jgi:hypothetical protein
MIVKMHFFGKEMLCRIEGSHSSGYEEFCFLGYNVVSSKKKPIKKLASSYFFDPEDGGDMFF